jgi:RecA/RadA recombinase
MVADLPNNYRWLISTGLNFLDELLEGGLHKGLIAQLYGESGTGKTQLCMQMMLGAAMQGVNSFYISSEKRLHS